MSVLNFQKYKFVVSYDKKTESRLGVIIQTYESVFLKYIKDRKSLTKEEETLLKDGINDIRKYVVFGLIYHLAFKPNKNNPLDRECLYYMNLAKKFYSKDYYQELLEDETMILAEDAIYESLGVIPGKEHKAFVKLTERANIVSYIQGIFYYKFLEFLKSHIGAYHNMGNISDETDSMKVIKDENRELLDGLISRSLLNKSVPLNVLNNIRECILSGNIDEEILPYVKFLANFKEQEKKICKSS